MEPGHRAFKFNKLTGVGNTIYREGWHLKLPYFERQIIYDVRTHPKVIKSSTGTKGKFEPLSANDFFKNDRFADCQSELESVVPTRLYLIE